MLLLNMLRNTFLHIPGIGEKKERNFWRHGILTWDDLIKNIEELPFAPQRRSEMLELVVESRARLERGDTNFFSSCIPSREIWRAYGEFKDSTAFLDIETTHTWDGDQITVIGIFNGQEVETLIDGINLKSFEEKIKKYSLLVTFNGASFDLPIIRRQFRGIRLDQIHIDLRYPLRRIGYKGGLKAVERALGIKRSPETEGMDGYDAVRLWREYRWGSTEALDLLVRYNCEDVVNLKPLMDLVYRRLKDESIGRFVIQDMEGG